MSTLKIMSFGISLVVYLFNARYKTCQITAHYNIKNITAFNQKTKNKHNSMGRDKDSQVTTTIVLFIRAFLDLHDLFFVLFIST